MRKILPMLVTVALLAACSDPVDRGGDLGADTGADAPRTCDPATCESGRIGTLYLGEGVPRDGNPTLLDYRALEDGDEVAVVPGFQGGQHIWVILRATDVERCFVTPRYEILDDDGVVLDATFGGEFYPVPDAEDLFEFFAYAAFVADPARVHDQSVTLRAEVSDGCGHLISDSVTVRPIDARLVGESDGSEI